MCIMLKFTCLLVLGHRSTSRVPSVLWLCWLGGRKGIRACKKPRGGGAGVVVCLEQDAHLHMAQLMPLPLTVSCFSKIQIGFAFLVPAHPDSPGKRAVKRVCVLSIMLLAFCFLASCHVSVWHCLVIKRELLYSQVSSKVHMEIMDWSSCC